MERPIFTWARVIAIVGSCLVIVPTLFADADKANFEFVDDEENGELKLMENGQPVFSFVYGPRLAEGVDERFRREGYLHPVYDTEGEPITMDFPGDHPHHRGVWLSWPWMQVRGKQVELWHPSPIRHQFNSWIRKEVLDDRATMVALTDWMLAGEKTGSEHFEVTAHHADGQGRILDLKFTFVAVGEKIQLRGQHDRGYGGLCVRTSQDLRHGSVHSDEGPLDGDVHDRSFNWVALASEQRGVTVFVHPENPGAPQSWLVRNSYGGILNPQWPGTEVAVLEPDEPLTLRYRMYVYRGETDPARLAEIYQQWIGE